MRPIWNLASVLTVALLTGCAFTPQAVEVQPKIYVPEMSTGKGRVVYVNVVDERSRQTLGTRGAGMGAELTIKGNLRSIISSSISGGLARQGFAPTPEIVAGARELRVEIRELDYEVKTGFWAGSLRTQCNLKGFCKQGAAALYENHHQGVFQSSIQVVQSEERNNQFVSDAVSRALDSLLADEKLMGCLASEQ